MDRLQAKADKKRLAGLPEKLKFLMNYPDDKIRSLRANRFKSMEMIAAVSWLVGFRNSSVIFPYIGIFILAVWFFGIRQLSAHKELKVVFETIK